MTAPSLEAYTQLYSAVRLIFFHLLSWTKPTPLLTEHSHTNTHLLAPPRFYGGLLLFSGRLLNYLKITFRDALSLRRFTALWPIYLGICPPTVLWSQWVSVVFAMGRRQASAGATLQRITACCEWPPQSCNQLNLFVWLKSKALRRTTPRLPPRRTARAFTHCHTSFGGKSSGG